MGPQAHLSNKKKEKKDKKYTNVQHIQMISCSKTPIYGRIAETHQEATLSVSPINPSLTSSEDQY